MPEQIRGAGLDACPTCRAAKSSYAQHWVRSTSCSFPPIDDALNHVVTGALLGDGSVQGTERARIRVETTNREFALWLWEAFGPLASGVRYDSEGGPTSDVYRVTTIAHPSLDRYRDWYRDGTKRIPEVVQLRQLTALVFYCCDGTLTFRTGDQPRLTFDAVNDDYREDLTETLSQLPIELDPQPAGESVAVGTADARRFLEWIGEPVPGLAHKWCLDRDASLLAKRRREQGKPVLTAAMEWSERYRALVSLAYDVHRNQSNSAFSPDAYDTLVATPNAATVADALGGGQWSDAVSVAGIQELRPNNSRTSRFTVSELLDSLRAAAEARDGPLTKPAYRQWRRERSPTTPSFSTIIRSFQSWSAACEAAGVSNGQSRIYDWEAILDAIQTANAGTEGESLSSTAYTDWRSQLVERSEIGEYPSYSAIYRHSQFDEWEALLDEALDR